MGLIWKYLFGILILILLVVWVAVLGSSDKNLRLIACDVGEGDAILAVYGSFEILTDGGNANGKVSKCLSKYMPFWDRELEVVVNTHPQLDHYGGLIEVFKNYKVDYFIANALDSGASEYQVLKSVVGRKGVKVVNPFKGQVIKYGMMHYDIYWPTKEFLTGEGYNGREGKLGAFTSKKDANEFSVQAHISFGKFKALLTGDIGSDMAAEVLPNLTEKTINYIKISHHGSKYGITPIYLSVIKPNFAVISVGKNNYGHPNQEIIKLLKDMGIKTFRTDMLGDIVLVTDGESYKINN